MGLRLQTTDYKFGESANRIPDKYRDYELTATTRLYDYIIIRFNIYPTHKIN